MYYKNADEIKRKNEFIKKTKKQLAMMETQEKDEWIIRQAQTFPESKQQDFLKSLSGEKLILDMPDDKAIEKFCKQVSTGEICLEYETHYYEFDDRGKYLDDWKVWYNDPKQAMRFIDKVFKGCHDLNKVGQYEQTNRILGQIFRLEFCVVEAKDTEDFTEDENLFTLDRAYKHGMLATNKTEVIYDWIYAYYMSYKDMKTSEFSQKALEIFMQPVCEVILPGNVVDGLEYKDVNSEMICLLDSMIEKDTIEVQEKYFKKYTKEGYYYKKRLERELNLLEDLKKLVEENKIDGNQSSILNSSWKQIQELLQWLSYEKYIDDQLEIEEIWKICEALIKHCNEKEELWEIRKQVWQDIIDHDGYDYFGCYDPMKDLLEVLCKTKEEYLAKADYMMKKGSGEYQKQAAKIYYEYGHDEEYISYLKGHLAKSADIYLELIKYYDSHNCKEKALETAREALDNCRDVKTTDIFIFLITEAYKAGNKAEATKLYRKAKQRRKILIAEVDKSLEGVKV